MIFIVEMSFVFCQVGYLAEFRLKQWLFFYNKYSITNIKGTLTNAKQQYHRERTFFFNPFPPSDFHITFSNRDPGQPLHPTLTCARLAARQVASGSNRIQWVVSPLVSGCPYGSITLDKGHLPCPC
jgi:hypothetical protein